MSSDLTEAERDIAVCNAIDDAWDDLCACLQATQRSAKRLQRLMRVCGMRLPADEARGHIRFFGEDAAAFVKSVLGDAEGQEARARKQGGW